MILNKLSAWVTDANGTALPEYQTREIDNNTIEYGGYVPLKSEVTDRVFVLKDVGFPRQKVATSKYVGRPQYPSSLNSTSNAYHT